MSRRNALYLFEEIAPLMSIQSFAWLGQGFVFFDVMGSNQNLKEKIQNYFQHQFMDLIVTTPIP